MRKKKREQLKKEKDALKLGLLEVAHINANLAGWEIRLSNRTHICKRGIYIASLDFRRV